jgi:hypothetical protein
MTFYTGSYKNVIEDYGLEDDYPLQTLYKIVYNFERFCPSSDNRQVLFHHF